VIFRPASRNNTPQAGSDCSDYAERKIHRELEIARGMRSASFADKLGYLRSLASPTAKFNACTSASGSNADFGHEFVTKKFATGFPNTNSSAS